MLWSSDGRSLIGLRALLRDEPRSPGTAWPDRFDVVRWGLSARGGMLIPRAEHPRLSPDGRLIAAFSQRMRSYAVFRSNGRLVRRIARFSIYAWAPALR
jgi:hypothetical protein